MKPTQKAEKIPSCIRNARYLSFLNFSLLFLDEIACDAVDDFMTTLNRPPRFGGLPEVS